MSTSGFWRSSTGIQFSTKDLSNHAPPLRIQTILPNDTPKAPPGLSGRGFGQFLLRKHLAITAIYSTFRGCDWQLFSEPEMGPAMRTPEIKANGGPEVLHGSTDPDSAPPPPPPGGPGRGAGGGGVGGAARGVPHADDADAVPARQPARRRRRAAPGGPRGGPGPAQGGAGAAAGGLGAPAAVVSWGAALFRACWWRRVTFCTKIFFGWRVLFLIENFRSNSFSHGFLGRWAPKPGIFLI